MKRKQSPNTTHNASEKIPLETTPFRKCAKIDDPCQMTLDQMHPMELKQFIEMCSKILRRKMLKLISELPDEIVLLILSFLSPVERIFKGPLYCCKQWNACIMNHENLWKTLWECLFSTTCKPYDPAMKPYLVQRARCFSNKCEITYWKCTFDNGTPSSEDVGVIIGEKGSDLVVSESESHEDNTSDDDHDETIKYDEIQKTKNLNIEKDSLMTTFASQFYILTKNPEIKYVLAEQGCGGAYSGTTLLLIDHLEGVYFPPNKTTFFHFTIMADFEEVDVSSDEYCYSFNVTLLVTLPDSSNNPITLISNNKIIEPHVKQLVTEHLQLSNDELVIPEHGWKRKKNMIPTDEIGWFKQWLQNFSFFDSSFVVDRLKVVENEQNDMEEEEEED
ncbi:hypothetical protein C9374_012938 [Naegleria lovaniensis]|uniref:F-box domain-containing protein n=1 Tax=Naegleria lovaniensis TaxID=51637 RepID=A0AA88KBC8_NAELO|nr:uncharacterized protein C9374_012938 [Naegleria lovaniensis]KAG2372995.1 hypothetical protein C9374_012938 [Naegleria lovaniensis]